MRIKTRNEKRKNEFSAMKFLILKNNRSKEVRKVFGKLEREQKGKERHLHNIFSHGFFVNEEKEKQNQCERWLDATDVRGRDQWQLNAHRLYSLKYVTTRSNGQEGFQSRTVSSTRVNLEISFFFFLKGDFFFLKKIRMIIFEHSFFGSKYVPSSKKVQKKMYFKKLFLERAFVEKILCLHKFKKKMKDTRKKPNRKRKKRKTQTQKIKKDNWKLEKSSCSQKKRWSKNQEEIKEVLFSSRKHFYRMRFFFSRKLSNDKRHKKEMIKYIFLRKLERRIFEKIIRKWDRDKHCWLQMPFCGIFFVRNSKNRFFKKEISKKIRKTMKDFFD